MPKRKTTIFDDGPNLVKAVETLDEVHARIQANDDRERALKPDGRPRTPAELKRYDRLRRNRP